MLEQLTELPTPLSELGRLEVGGMGVTAALFLGAAVAHWDGVLVLSTQEISLLYLRLCTFGRECRLGRQHTPADYAVMLGAFALNPSLQGSLSWPFLRFPPGSSIAEQEIVLDAYDDAGLFSGWSAWRGRWQVNLT